MLSQLPFELLVAVCSGLNPAELAQVRLTCRYVDTPASCALHDLTLEVPEVLEEWHRRLLSSFEGLQSLNLATTVDTCKTITEMLLALPRLPPRMSIDCQPGQQCAMGPDTSVVQAIQNIFQAGSLQLTIPFLFRIPYSTPQLQDSPPAVQLSLTCCDVLALDQPNPAISSLTISALGYLGVNPDHPMPIQMEYLDAFSAERMPSLRDLHIELLSALPLPTGRTDLSQITRLHLRECIALDEESIATLSSSTPNLQQIYLFGYLHFPTIFKGFAPASWPRLLSMCLEYPEPVQGETLRPNGPCFFPGELITKTSKLGLEPRTTTLRGKHSAI